MDEKSKSQASKIKPDETTLLNRLLGCHTVRGSREQVSRFSIRIGELADLNGEEWVRRHSAQLIAQWELALEDDGPGPKS